MQTWIIPKDINSNPWVQDPGHHDRNKEHGKLTACKCVWITRWTYNSILQYLEKFATFVSVDSVKCGHCFWVVKMHQPAFYLNSIYGFGHSIWVILKKKIKKFYKSWSCYVSKHRLTGKSFANECAVSQSGPPSDFTGFLLILRHQNGTSETSDLRHSS